MNLGLLKHIVLPNWHWKRGHYDEAVRTRKYDKRPPADLWPTPRPEDDGETEESDGGSESGGEHIMGC